MQFSLTKIHNKIMPNLYSKEQVIMETKHGNWKDYISYSKTLKKWKVTGKITL